MASEKYIERGCFYPMVTSVQPNQMQTMNDVVKCTVVAADLFPEMYKIGRFVTFPLAVFAFVVCLLQLSRKLHSLHLFDQKSNHRFDFVTWLYIRMTMFAFGIAIQSVDPFYAGFVFRFWGRAMIDTWNCFFFFSAVWLIVFQWIKTKADILNQSSHRIFQMEQVAQVLCFLFAVGANTPPAKSYVHFALQYVVFSLQMVLIVSLNIVYGFAVIKHTAKTLNQMHEMSITQAQGDKKNERVLKERAQNKAVMIKLYLIVIVGPLVGLVYFILMINSAVFYFNLENLNDAVLGSKDEVTIQDLKGEFLLGILTDSGPKIGIIYLFLSIYRKVVDPRTEAKSKKLTNHTSRNQKGGTTAGFPRKTSDMMSADSGAKAVSSADLLATPDWSGPLTPKSGESLL